LDKAGVATSRHQRGERPADHHHRS
jgi:hypothetical protein